MLKFPLPIGKKEVQVYSSIISNIRGYIYSLSKIIWAPLQCNLDLALYDIYTCITFGCLSPGSLQSVVHAFPLWACCGMGSNGCMPGSSPFQVSLYFFSHWRRLLNERSTLGESDGMKPFFFFSLKKKVIYSDNYHYWKTFISIHRW